MKLIGSKPMTNAEKQARYRANKKANTGMVTILPRLEDKELEAEDAKELAKIEAEEQMVW